MALWFVPLSSMIRVIKPKNMEWGGVQGTYEGYRARMRVTGYV
jgi:hypothetical protein